jgi:hypothetical protein
MQEQRSGFRSHAMMYRISENMIKITEDLFSAVHKFVLSEWNCGDLHHVNKKWQPSDRDLS